MRNEDYKLIGTIFQDVVYINNHSKEYFINARINGDMKTLHISVRRKLDNEELLHKCVYLELDGSYIGLQAVKRILNEFEGRE